MQKIFILLFKCIGGISLVMGLYGLTFSVIEYLYPEIPITGIWSAILPVGFNPQFLGLVKISWQFIGVIYYLMMVVGGCQFMKQKLDSSGLLRFCFSVMFYSSIMQILWGILRPLMFMQMIKQSGQTYPWLGLLWILYPVFLLILSRFVVKEMDSALKTTPEGNFSEPIENILKTETGKTERFMHLVVDILITLSLVLPLFYAVQFLLGQRDMMRSSRFLFLTLILVHRFIYYLVLEGVFHATPAKYLTRSTIVNSEGTLQPDFGKITARSLFRFIPFEPFSFLGTSGWHDSLSGTLVVKDPYVKPGKSYNGVWILLLFILPMGHYAFGLFKKEKMQQNRSEFEERIRHEKRDGEVKHLSADNLIVYMRKNKSYLDGYFAFKIDSVGKDSVWGYSFKIEYNDKDQITALNKIFLTTDKKMKGNMAIKDIVSMYLDEVPVQFKDQEFYLIEKIYTIYQPSISIGSSSSSSRNMKSKTEKVNWTLIDELEPATLESIQNLKGKVSWNSSLPLKFSWSEESKSGFLTLTGEFENQRSDFKSLLIFSDSSNQKYKYILEGFDSTVRIYRTY